MKFVVPLFCVLGLAIALTGFAQDVKEVKDDKVLIEGAWTIESSQDGGQDTPEIKGFVLVLKEGKLTVRRGDQDVGTGTYQLDTSKSPKWIDTTLTDITCLGIYELKDDTLKICHGKPGDRRSTQFASEAGSANRVLTVLQREKK
jgi:uncharacterized protein (TIGR03067 family)